MKQDKWLNCSDSEQMLNFIGAKLSDHHLRKFSVACYRQIEQYLTDEARLVIEAIEAEINGQPDPDAFKVACGMLATEVFEPSNSSSPGGVIDSYVFVVPREPPAL
jgi:uncharacterized protein (DUF2164 family)